jgi:hypothetical protein
VGGVDASRIWPGGVIASAKIVGDIDGRLVVGAKLTTRVKGYTPTMTIDHVIEPVEAGTRITERATMSGPLAGVAARVLGNRLAKTFTATTAHTARLAEDSS